MHVAQLHLHDGDPEPVAFREILQPQQGFGLDFLAANGQHLIHGPVADDFAHGRFARIAQGLAG